ncbi:MAG: DUF1330 domain-containing protein [Pseudomonadota bacterium]
MASINPTREQFRAIGDLPGKGPILMVNLLRFRDKAVYAAGDPEFGETPVSGEDAYRRYAHDTERLVLSLGGSQNWIGLPMLTVIGPEDEQWHHAFVARYPSAQSFMDMVRNPDYQKAVRHRTAAVSDSRLICCREADAGETFLAGGT